MYIYCDTHNLRNLTSKLSTLPAINCNTISEYIIVQNATVILTCAISQQYQACDVTSFTDLFTVQHL